MKNLIETWGNIVNSQIDEDYTQDFEKKIVEINKVGDLKKFLKNIPDDFAIEGWCESIRVHEDGFDVDVLGVVPFKDKKYIEFQWQTQD